MKLKPEHVEHMRAAIAALPEFSRITQAAYRSAGLSMKRWRWDLARAAGLIPYMCSDLYPYANDDHIDAALRVITATE